MRQHRLALSLLQIALLTACVQRLEPDDGAGTDAGPAFPCPPGAVETATGCEPAGVPPGRCGSGFTPDGAQGCVPVLPAEAGPPGQMAVPGEAAWREVAPCGTGPWGDAPIDETTEFVDASYAGADSDGTEARPWTTIQDAIDRAAEGSVIAIAEGSYVEELLISGQPVRLWGRCPARVEIVGPPAAIAVQVDRGASATEIHDLAVRGQGMGLGVANAREVLVERVWIHDTSDVGVLAAGLEFKTSLTLRGALVEHTTGAGMVVADAAVTLEGTVLRDIDLATGDPGHPFDGHAIAMQVESFERRASVTARSVVIERVGGLGIRFSGADGVIEDSVVRDVAWLAAELPGTGLAATHIPSFDPGTLTVRGSVLERNHTAAIAMIGAEATIEATVVRDTGLALTEGDPGHGMGLYTEPSRVDDRPARVALRHVLVERSRERGVVVNGSDVEIDGLLVREILPGAPDYGAGLEIAHDQRRASAQVRGSAVEGSYGMGIAVFGADATLDSTVVRDTRPLPSNEEVGRGVNVQSLPDLGERGSARLSNVLIERSRDGGIFLSDSDATVDSTTITDTLGRALDGGNGHGYGIIAYNNETGQADALVRDSVIERSTAAGIYNVGATVRLASTTFTCEPLYLVRYVDERSPAVYEDLGGNVCGCDGRTIDCKAEPTRLEPPRALPPPPPLPESED
ncbi:right-handed parallel beta-helix repeat-containing protein [Sorangium atrum]|uniref:Right-handed parallel beta-helix repeat-containing protein n=1 Tax=Sorangium atrum TaxID=2995308 RepID=A0ABT5C057_9BACT|nr:right-handed parallel beta-helix repeat-containing protein [Sorangium aterium]MDC0679804.1 right-handed parallel beta-helix repeat-containing protein [Sorangium aterium]